MLKGKEKKTQMKRGESVSASDARGDKDDSVEESLTAGDLETTTPSTDDDESILSKPASKKAKTKTTPDAPLSYLAVLNDDQHFTIIQEVVVAKEEYTPSNRMHWKLIALAGLTQSGECRGRHRPLSDRGRLPTGHRRRARNSCKARRCPLPNPYKR
jgi:hypothetical protein